MGRSYPCKWKEGWSRRRQKNRNEDEAIVRYKRKTSKQRRSMMSSWRMGMSQLRMAQQRLRCAISSHRWVTAACSHLLEQLVLPQYNVNSEIWEISQKVLNPLESICLPQLWWLAVGSYSISLKESLGIRSRTTYINSTPKKNWMLLIMDLHQLMRFSNFPLLSHKRLEQTGEIEIIHKKEHWR
jgi:hypothetical protein